MIDGQSVAHTNCHKRELGVVMVREYGAITGAAEQRILQYTCTEIILSQRVSLLLTGQHHTNLRLK